MSDVVSVDFNQFLLDYAGEPIRTKVPKDDAREIVESSDDPNSIDENDLVQIVELTAGHVTLLSLVAFKDDETTTEEDKWLRFSLAEQIRTEDDNKYTTINIGKKKKDLILKAVSSQWNSLVYGRIRILLGDSISEEE
jgi:hypothetical protein